MVRIRWLEVALIVSMISLVGQLLPYVARAWRKWPRPGKQTLGHVFIPGGASSSQISYLLYLPDDYSKQQRWPLLLFLHGRGQRGNDVQQVTKCGPPYSVAQGKQLPMIIVSPQCRADEVWQPEQLLALLDQVEKKFSIDRDRIYAAGYSMGGYGTWDLISIAPDRFAAAVPVAGGGDVDQADRLVTMPIWAFHGADDEVVHLKENQRMVEAIQAGGGQARLTVLEDQAHGICNLVFSQDDLYEWLLQQRRAQN